MCKGLSETEARASHAVFAGRPRGRAQSCEVLGRVGDRKGAILLDLLGDLRTLLRCLLCRAVPLHVRPCIIALPTLDGEAGDFQHVALNVALDELDHHARWGARNLCLLYRDICKLHGLLEVNV